ncbi:hypothetical protein [Streptomyces sp. NPDC006134]|uniref:hypothetical protein n=1 Tax=Streptomyces sp. NPDC006134 TaxID=3154467 RepID=UPI0033E88BA5
MIRFPGDWPAECLFAQLRAFEGPHPRFGRFLIVESARNRWRAVHAPRLVALVRAGAHVERGILVERPDQEAA